MVVQWQAEWVAFLSQHLRPFGNSCLHVYMAEGGVGRGGSHVSWALSPLSGYIAYKASTEDGRVKSEVSSSHSNISPRMACCRKQDHTYLWLCAPRSICAVTTERGVFLHTQAEQNGGKS